MLASKVIIVTGGNGLIGKAVIEDIRKKGGIAICADIGVDTNLDQFLLKCDITDLSSIREALEAVWKKFGRIDGLVNNAYPRTPDWGNDFLDITEESLRNNVNWQLNSYILFCQQVIDYMLRNKGGSIVNVASIYGIVGNDFTIYEGTNINPPAAYSAIKGGLINFTKYLASRYGKDNIRVNSVSPGGVFDNQPESFVLAYSRKTPLGRMAFPEDIAPAIGFLISEDSKYITGHNLVVDGGWTIV